MGRIIVTSFWDRCCFLTFMQHLEANFSFLSAGQCPITSLIIWCTLNYYVDGSIWYFDFPQGIVSTYFRWSGHFRHSFIVGLFQDNLCNFYWNRFIFDRQRAKDKLAQFFLRHGVVSLVPAKTCAKFWVYSFICSKDITPNRMHVFACKMPEMHPKLVFWGFRVGKFGILIFGPHRKSIPSETRHLMQKRRQYASPSVL